MVTRSGVNLIPSIFCEGEAMTDHLENWLDPVGHRRTQLRLQLGIPARLQTLNGLVAVQLLDLSRTGARLELPSREPLGCAVLFWLTFEAFGDLVWENGHFVGLQFETELPVGCIVRTRQLAPDVVISEETDARAVAAAWVTGSVDLGCERN